MTFTHRTAALLLASAALSLALPVAAQAPEIVTNTTVLRMIEAGLPEQAIIAKIKASPTQFDLSTDQLIALQKQNVSGAVLAAMLTPAEVAPQELSTDSPDPAVAHYPGVYMFGAQDKVMVRMMATTSNQAKTGGILGYALTGGIASLSVKAVIPGTSARVQSASARPVFYFYFDESVPRALQSNANSIWTSGLGGTTSSPAELSLVRFNEKKEAREARVGSVNIGGAKTGVMDKDRVGFDSVLVRPGVFKVTPTADLLPGEYGFLQSLSGGNATGGGATARVFDFGIAG